MSTSLGDRIQEARRRAGFKNAESFAEALGVSTATVARYEQGQTTPTLGRLAEIAALTKKPLGHFIAEGVAA